MINVIKSWLLLNLGVLLEDEVWNSEMTAILLAKLLYRYDLITKVQLKSVEKRDEDSESTFKYIKEVINQLSIELSTEDFEDILAGHSTKAIILFYELYLALSDKTIMYFMSEKKLKNNLDEYPEKFKVQRVPSQSINLKKFKNPLAENLQRNSDVLDWHKCKLKTIVDRCKASREAYLTYLAENENKNTLDDCKPNTAIILEKNDESKGTHLCSDDKTLNLTYDDLLEEEKRAKELCGMQPDYQKAKGFINSIKTKRKVVNARKENQERMQRMLLKELWEKILNEQQKYFEGQFREQFLKQTVYEQQMATILLEIREESNRMRENKRKLMDCIRTEHEQRFISSLMSSKRNEQNEKNSYYAEKELNLELHERLYAQKLKRKALKHYNICLEAIESIADIAIFQSDFEKYNCQVMPKKKWHDLVSLFIKGKPIFNELERIDLLNYIPDELPEDLETVYIAEIEKDNCIDDMVFESYCKNTWCWTIEDDFPSFDYNLITFGNNILGFIVHRLLLMKYPKTRLPPPPAIPKPSVAVCANGLTDLKYIPVLEKLFQNRKIKIIQMQDAINYCLAVWKEESTIEYMETALTEVKEVEKKKTKPKAKGKKRDKKEAFIDTQKLYEEKNVQTPKLFPGEELVLTPAGNMGMLAYEILNLGDTPNDNLMVGIFIEYLKSLQDIEGWVLINFPKTIEQVAILEQSLNSTPFPVYNMINDTLEDIVDTSSRELLQNVQPTDTNIEKRLSKLVPNPKPMEVPIFNTYLTAYIEMRSAEGDDIEEQYYDSFRSVENDNIINRFYMDQGCKYTLIYKEIDFPTVKHLGKLILGDYSLPRKTSVELFTDTVKYVEAEFEKLIDDSVAEKIEPAKDASKKQKNKKAKKSSKSDNDEPGKEKPKKDKPNKEKPKKEKPGGKKKDKKLKSTNDLPLDSVLEHEDKETQAPEEDIEPAIPIDKESVHSTPEIPQPGDENWIYVNLPFPEELQKILATIWENMEEVYINDMKILFFRERVVADRFQPYRTFFTNYYHEFLLRPSDKNKHLHEFQVWYNQIDEDMRADEEVKAELHMRVHEFEEQLFRFCDDMLRENEEERLRLIRADWLTNILLEVINIYISIMQLEIDRCADTMQLLNDYYTCMVTKNVPQDRPLAKIKLKFIPMPTELNKTEGYEEYITFVENSCQIRKLISDECPFHDNLVANEKTCIAKLNEYKKSSQAVYEKLSSFFVPGKKGLFEPDEEVKSRASELLEEYKCAYLGEVERTEFRIQLASFKGQKWSLQLLYIALDTFFEMILQNELNYNNHIASVKKACGFFKRAIEEETKIQPEMVFEQDKFYIKLDSVLYESELPELFEKVSEQTAIDVFTIDQLNKFIDILSDLAPNGMIPERTLTFLLQDLLVCHKIEDGKKPIVPELWMQMHPHSTHKLMQTIFGDSEYIDWKDFIIYNLGIEFPTEAELMKTRESFRKLDTDITELIYEHQFADVDFWFDFSDEDRMRSIIDLLIRMFKIDHERINYTALLLSFCKDENPLAGLAKAIELSLGQIICWRHDQGELYFNWLRKNILEMKMEQREGELMVDDILSEIIDTSIHRSTSTYLEDYVEPEEFQANQDEEDNKPAYDDIISYLHETTKNMNECEESSASLFTNLSQGFECTDKFMEYFLDFDTLINVLTVCLPWYARNNNVGNYSLRQKIALIYQAKFNKEFNRVFTYQLFNDPNFVELISGVYKFSARYPCDVVKTLVNKN